MKDSAKKLILLGGLALIIVAYILIKNLTSAKDYHDKYAGADLTTDVEGAIREGTYTRYKNAHAGAVYPTKSVDVSLKNYTSGEDVKFYDEYEGRKNVLYTGDRSKVTWEVNVPESGYYNVYLEYFPVKSRGVEIERALYINDRIPFEGASNMTFDRLWADGAAPKVDNQGNEIRPIQVEKSDWCSAFCRDDRGYEIDPYLFYLEKGSNKIGLEAINEPMAIGKLEIAAVKKNFTYQEYINAHKEAKASGSGLEYVGTVQGEAADVRSDSSLYAKYDRSSPTTQPYNLRATVLNYTGGDAWSSAGQWIQWTVDVPENGYYHITVKGRQNYARGSSSARTLYIDGEIPFEEVKDITFDYANDWENKTLSNTDGEPYRFYLTAGKHTLRLEAALGKMGPILEDLEDSTYRLNQMYRRLLVYIGASPDTYRDYHIDQIYPEIIQAMDLEAKRLYKAVDDVVAATGQKADKIATAQTLAQQLEKFVERPDKISVEFVTFKDNITALGTAILNMSETKLDVDYITVSGENAKLKKDKAGALAKFVHEVKSFEASFFVDYDAVGDVYDKDEAVKVWVLTGRDQGTILKSMVDDTFTPQSGVKINVEIVGADALLSAVVAGRGPNVVLSVGADQPVNYALRNAVEDLAQFSDLKDTLEAFTPSSYKQYTLDEHVYALPETQMFNVMFYRKDIMEELELEVPQTWKELIELMPTIQGNNMAVGIPSAANNGAGSTSPDLSMYFTMLYQYDGDLYNEPGTATTVDNEAGVKAFSDYTKYFTDYGVPTAYDFVTRFRSGEIPIGITNYTVYNTLVVSAPEIRGLWDFTLIPGTEKKDANGNTYIDRSDFITGSATMMIKTDDEKKRKESWEFMKWWVSEDTQVRFGRELEALLGASARYATANVKAFNQLAWSAEDIDVLNAQWSQTVGIREVPGGYYTGRHISNAIRKVINEKVDPRETILDYAITIDEEITKKRREFGMSVN